jgi:hypothetical protein
MAPILADRLMTFQTYLFVTPLLAYCRPANGVPAPQSRTGQWHSPPVNGVPTNKSKDRSTAYLLVGEKVGPADGVPTRIMLGPANGVPTRIMIGPVRHMTNARLRAAPRKLI